MVVVVVVVVVVRVCASKCVLRMMTRAQPQERLSSVKWGSCVQ